MTSRATARVTAPSARTTPRVTTRSTRGTTRSTPRPELRLVPGGTVARPRRLPTAALRHRRAPYVLLVVALLIGTTLGLLVLNTTIAVDSLKATQLRVANAERAEEVQRLEQQVVSGSTPAEIAQAAKAAGLVPAGPAAYLVIGPDGESVLRGTYEPGQAPGDAEDGD